MTSPLDIVVDPGSIDLSGGTSTGLAVDVTPSSVQIDISSSPIGLSLGGAAAPDPDVIVVPGVGPQGPAGAAGADGAAQASFNFTQAVASATWTIVHNLNVYPAVGVRVGGSGVLAEVVYDSLNQVTVKFARAQSGTAHLI